MARRTRYAARGAWVLLAALSFLLPASACDDPGAASSATGAAPSIAHWDPVTRRFTAPPPAAARSLTTAPPGGAAPPLREEPAPRGGTMVRLGSHFRHHLTAATMGDGRVRGSCALEPQLTSVP